MKKWTFFALLTLALSAHAEDRDTQVIQFSDKDLAKESVLPVFRYTEAVKNRNVPTEGRFDIGVQAGAALNEAFFNPYSYGIDLTYHLNDVHAIEVYAMFFTTSQSQYVGQLNEDLNEDFQFKNVPNTKYLLMGSWEYTPYYGKISITKQTVFNIAIFTLLGGGIVDTGDGTTFHFGAGFGQKVYFTPNFGLKADLRAMFYKAPNVVSNRNRLDPNPPSGTYDPKAPLKEENRFNMMFSLGVFMTFPTL